MTDFGLEVVGEEGRGGEVTQCFIIPLMRWKSGPLEPLRKNYGAPLRDFGDKKCRKEKKS